MSRRFADAFRDAKLWYPSIELEPTLNRVLTSKQYRDRVTVLNNTFNVGCSGFAKRWERSLKPIRVSHFHRYNRTAWETHALDRNGLDEKGLAVELSDSGKAAQCQRRTARLAQTSSN